MEYIAELSTLAVLYVAVTSFLLFLLEDYNHA
jgi:hypothetical protein